MKLSARPRSSRLANLGALVIGVSLAISACGGGGGESAGVPDSPADPPVAKVFQNFQPAVGVLGQAGFTSGDGNRGGSPNAATLADPMGVAVSPEGMVFVADSDNRRVLVYRSLSGSLGQPADFVIGQSGFDSGAYTGDSAGFAVVTAVAVGAGKLAVADYAKNRVLIFSADQPNTAAPIVVGQPDLAASTTDCDDSHLKHPEAVQITPDGKLIVADSWHHRVLIWERIPSVDGQPADAVLGQSSMTDCAPKTSQAGMANPGGLWSDGTRLAVADTNNHRVLLWDALTMMNGQEADKVLGQSEFNSSIEHLPSETTTKFPKAVAFNGSYLAVADNDRNRVLLWAGWPDANSQAATLVLGQKEFTLSAANDANGDGSDEETSPTAQTMYGPEGLAFHQDTLLVADSLNNRILIFKPN